MALNVLHCADVPLKNYSLIHSLMYCFHCWFSRCSLV